MDTGGVCGHSVGGLTVRAVARAAPARAVTPSPQLTDRIRLHAHRSRRIDAGDRQQFGGPGDADRRRQRRAGLRRRGARARGRAAAATPCRRPSSPCRAGPVAASPTTPTGWPASIRAASPTARRTPSPATTSTVVSSRRPALDSVTSSSRAVPAGVPGGATPTTAAVVREPVSDTASHSRMPRAAMASGCSRTTPRRESSGRGVQPRGERQARGRRRCAGDGLIGHAQRPGLRRPSRATDRRLGCWARRIARRAARCCLGFVVPRPRGARPPSAGCAPRTGCG